MLHLSAGIELVFKSRLDIEHWTYIFDDMNHASRNKYTDGSLKTVDSNTAIERLVNLVSPDYNKTAGDVKDIAAGAVLICAIAAAIVGLIIFLPKLI